MRAVEFMKDRLAKETPHEAAITRESIAIIKTANQLPDDSFEAIVLGRTEPREKDVRRLLDYQLGAGHLEYRTALGFVTALVPPVEPRRYPWPAIDETLSAFMEMNDRPSEVLVALARRGSDKVWQPPQKPTNRPFPDVPAISISTFRNPAVHREKLRAHLAAELAKDSSDVENIATAAWLCDLRGLAPALERRATSSADDFDHYAQGGRRHPVRWVLALWHEPNPATRAKLLLAYAVGAQLHPEKTPEAWSRLKEQFDEAWRALDATGQKDVSDFLTWCETEGQPQVAASLEFTKADPILKALEKLVSHRENK
jgi:hypothetical protein